MVNLYEMGQKIIKAKQGFLSAYANLKEHQYSKLDKELWEEEILEMEYHYIETCKLYNDYDENDHVLSWEMAAK